MKLEKNCPIPQTHTRLRRAHGLWHDALDGYPDADAFVQETNSLISALRSVTLLQKELRHRDGFDNWYEPRQDRMRGDDRLRWLVEARNEIEKEGDLASNSSVRIQTQRGGEVPDPVDLVIPPLLSPSEVAETFANELDLPSDTTLIVERRWVVASRPDDELLDLLAHCYGEIASVVIEAHEWCGVAMRTFGGEAHGGAHSRLVHPSGRLPCMSAGATVRTARWDMGADREIAIMSRPIPEPPEGLGHPEAPLRRRYESVVVPRPTAGDPLSLGRALHNWGKQILVIDGDHPPTAWMVLATGLVSIRMEPDSRPSFDAMMDRLEREVQQAGASAVVISADAWAAPAVLDPRDRRAFMRPAERPDRSEAFVTRVASRDGAARTFSTPYTRVRGQIVLGQTSQVEAVKDHFLRRLLRQWEAWPRDAG